MPQHFVESCIEGQVRIRAFIDNGYIHIDGDGDPDSGLDLVFRGCEEGLEPEVLHDPLEEDFDMPAAFVEQGDAHGKQHNVIGQEGQMLFLLGVNVFHQAKVVGIVLQEERGDQQDGLVI
jgi:hypothetical protein